MEHQRIIDRELDQLRDRFLLLGGAAEAALRSAIRSLHTRDSDLAQRVLDGDDKIDQIEIEIDLMCVDIIALRQPAARDLRLVLAVAKMTPILERIADHACNIARTAIDLNDEPELNPGSELPRMADVASEMLHSALTAFTTSDPETARTVIGSDREINSLYDTLFRDLIALMTTEPATASRAARLLFVAKHLERIGDYVTDLCELTVYMAEAEVIKHRH